MSTAISPLAPKAYPAMPAIAGVAFATAEAGIKYKNRTDVLLAVFDKGTQVAGVFTRSKCRSAPVDWCADALARRHGAGPPRQFRQCQRLHRQDAAARPCASPPRWWRRRVGCPAKQVYLASTGVIGEPLDPAKFERRHRQAAPPASRRTAGRTRRGRS